MSIFLFFKFITQEHLKYCHQFSSKRNFFLVELSGFRNIQKIAIKKNRISSKFVIDETLIEVGRLSVHLLALIYCSRIKNRELLALFIHIGKKNMFGVVERFLLIVVKDIRKYLVISTEMKEVLVGIDQRKFVSF